MTKIQRYAPNVLCLQILVVFGIAGCSTSRPYEQCIFQALKEGRSDELGQYLVNRSDWSEWPVRQKKGYLQALGSLPSGAERVRQWKEGIAENIFQVHKYCAERGLDWNNAKLLKTMFIDKGYYPTKEKGKRTRGIREYEAEKDFGRGYLDLRLRENSRYVHIRVYDGYLPNERRRFIAPSITPIYVTCFSEMMDNRMLVLFPLGNPRGGGTFIGCHIVTSDEGWTEEAQERVTSDLCDDPKLADLGHTFAIKIQEALAGMELPVLRRAKIRKWFMMTVNQGATFPKLEEIERDLEQALLRELNERGHNIAELSVRCNRIEE